MGCIKGLARFILALISLIFGILWLAVTVLGGIVAWGTPVVKNLLASLLQPFITQLNNQGITVDMNAVTNLILGLANTVGIVIFVIALILTLICLAGLFGSCCDSPCLLYSFASVLIVLVAAQIIFVIIYFVKPSIFFDPAQAAFTKTTSLYQGSKGTNGESLLWNLIQPWQSCCGSVSAHDFDNSTWDHRETYNGVTITVQFPVTCCNQSNLGTGAQSCPLVFTSQNSFIDYPCFNRLQSQLTSYSNIVMWVFVGVLIGQGILIAIAFAVACSSSKSKSKQTY